MKQIGDRFFKPYIVRKQIEERIEALGQEISADYEGKEIALISVLKGAFMFTADLVRSIRVPVDIHFIQLSSYSAEQSTGKVTEVIGLNGLLAGKQVLIVEDIIDTGLTISVLHKKILQENPADIKIASLLLKEDVYSGSLKIDYLGFAIPNRFVVGYGLDLNELGRNWPEIYQVNN